jgi:hypothetical protein
VSRVPRWIFKIGGNYRKFKQLLEKVLDEIGGIYYKFGKNSKKIGGDLGAMCVSVRGYFSCKKCEN